MANPEYIVVGSGAGGGPLAARLAELGHRVLLLEAGGDDEPWTYQVPVFHGLATEDETMRLDHYVRHYADEARQVRDPKYQVEREAGRSGVFYPRARTLGGCTAHYAMIIIRPHSSDWRAIREATGDASWAPAEMNKYFERVEHCHYLHPGSGGGHGDGGWLPTRFTDTFDLLGEAIRRQDASIGHIASAAAKAAGIGKRKLLQKAFERFAAKHSSRPDPFDPNDLNTLGDEILPLRVPMALGEKRQRAGTRERIQAARRVTGRLEVRLHRHVTELVFDANDERRVIGVRYRPGERLYRADRDSARFGRPSGPDEEVLAEREVILSAGAFITPQLQAQRVPQGDRSGVDSHSSSRMGRLF